ncbi:hypothetical protein Ahy_A07g034478 [Arachis hypogaea]|uniref:Transposase MuDR plant domain-containing protein n=1 Tax=Arachis hypogaea TaxID=3818 RepID=A0A445CCA5_ARAHY|nr:hypothetical protein Ahy_A07g034478 [Arachis hypogaea]
MKSSRPAMRKWMGTRGGKQDDPHNPPKNAGSARILRPPNLKSPPTTAPPNPWALAGRGGADFPAGPSFYFDKFLAFRRNEDTPNSEDDDLFPVFREETRFGKLQLEVGMKFNTKMDFKEAVREYCIQEGRRVRFKKNDNVRCRILCRGEKCPWVIYISKDSEIVCWQVKTFNNDHTCSRETKNKLANGGWCKNGFRTGCRPLIRLDRAFQKTKFGGQILAAIYIIAYAIVLVENTNNWRWFLQLLQEDLGSYTQNEWCFILDM